MPNPEYLLCDTDALLQVFITKQGRLLVHLRQQYGVTAGVLPEVESEISYHSKFKTAFEPVLQKFLRSGNVMVVDSPEVRRLLAARGISGPELEQQFRAIWARGQRYGLRVGKGEAYSHAVGSTLKLPLMSHDWKAVETLARINEPVAVPVVGFFDLLALAYHDGALDERECQRAVRDLIANGERVPPLFRTSSSEVAEVIRGFPRRLCGWGGESVPPVPQTPTSVLHLLVNRPA